LAANSAMDGHHNVHFTTSLLLGDVDACIEALISTDRIPEAAFFARTHCPSQLQRVMSLWKEKADRVQKNTSRRIGESLADPVRYENLFPEWSESKKAESYLRELSKLSMPASVHAPTNQQRNVMEELKTALNTGKVFRLADLLHAKYHSCTGAVTFDETGQAHLRGMPRKTTPLNDTSDKVPNSVLKHSPTVAESVNVVPNVSHALPAPREPTPEPGSENGIQLSDDDSDGLSREAAAAAAFAAEPDVVCERPRPDVVPHHGGPDLLPQRTQPEVHSDIFQSLWKFTFKYKYVCMHIRVCMHNIYV
uniref:Coatomer_WDAD domain-containing protein n=1 Tax=Angiostrongylus cantonensis TaxID=6313 RepID=A0A0K0D5F9_ANGCA